MKTLNVTFFTLLLCAISAASHAGQWHFGFGPSYLSGVKDVLDTYENNLYAESDSVSFPIGVAFDANYEMASGFRVGFGAGPAFYMLLEVDNGSSTEEYDHFELAFNGNIGYVFVPGSSVSPYVKAGIVEHAVSGEFVVSNNPGFLGAVGINFARTSFVSYAVELAYDGSEIVLEDYSNFSYREKTLNSYGTTLSFYVYF